MDKDKLIEQSAKLIGEIVDNYEADAINLPAQFYNDLKFLLKQLKKIELVKEEPEGVTAEEILKDEQSTYTWNLICKTPVAYGSDIMLKDWIVQAMESYASSKQIDLRKEFDTSKVYISPSKEMITIFLDGKWQIFVRNDVAQEILKNIYDYTDSKWNVMKQ